ncbi:SpoIIE family protein phosphatase [Streptantibioticus rubrisoli]|uniref:SpoIIE family protein phosphatase n=1 Tax=Streptantibioticus rubrisoli TaxID=1387313 RepID=A0ABT1P755_9ACTN|nr:SpoIIE family protein phosphatase [Streptantibioticus rubrisoli]MCQ4041202.1 SpoIIE family protein phosphatase [Streptantibioticus rubrisoli]
MSTTDAFPAGLGGPESSDASAPPGGLLDVLSVAAVVLDATGRITLWSPQAEKLFGYSAEEALGRYAARLLVDERNREQILKLFAEVMAVGENWAGVFPVRHKDGSTRLVEFRNMRLQDAHHGFYALGIATDQATLRRLETELSLSVRLVSQSPIGLCVLDTDLRYVSVNPALERIDGIPADQHIGHRVREVLSFLDVDRIEASMRQVLESGVPLLDQFATGRTPADPDNEHAWSVSYYRLEDPAGRVLGLAASVVDITERHRAATEAAQARERLTLIADATVRIGTTLDLDQTARELAEVCVPALADVAAVDVLDSIMDDRRGNSGTERDRPAFRALAVAAAYPTEATRAADPTGDVAAYDPDRLVTQAARTGRPVLVPRVRPEDLPRIARDPAAAELLARCGLHSYLAVPLIARGAVVGALDLKRARNPVPFTEDDAVLASELAARAAVCIDNARWYQAQRRAALTLQRDLLPPPPPRRPGLEVAYRYQPAAGTSEVGGDWFDVIPLAGDRTALVVGDVMGSGISAAATMGQLRTATRALAELSLDPSTLLGHLDHIADGLGRSTTCVYVVHDAQRAKCKISNAGHLPPVLMRPGQPPQLLDLPTGAPLGVGGVPFETTVVDLAPGDQLVLYTDGLVETRDTSIDVRLGALLDVLSGPPRPLETTCDVLLRVLRHPDDHDDVALLIARSTGVTER